MAVEAARDSRSANIDDFPSLATWLCQLPLFQRYGWQRAPFIKTLQGAFRGGDWLRLIMDHQGSACAFAWGQASACFGRAPYLRLIAVREAQRRRGLGHQLLSEAETWAANRQPSLTLLVSDDNQAAQRFYRRAGYHEIGRLPAFVLPDVDEIIFHKLL